MARAPNYQRFSKTVRYYGPVWRRRRRRAIRKHKEPGEVLGLRIKLDFETTFSDKFKDSVEWAIENGLLTEDEAVVVMAETIIGELVVEKVKS
jgi:hypothetical protein